MTKGKLNKRSVYWLAVVAAVAVGCARPLPPAERVVETNVVSLRTSFGGPATEAAVAAAAPAAEPTGWATIKGSFKLNGSPPKPTALSVTKDHEVCAPGGKQVLSEELVVDSAT